MRKIVISLMLLLLLLLVGCNQNVQTTNKGSLEVTDNEQPPKTGKDVAIEDKQVDEAGKDVAIEDKQMDEAGKVAANKEQQPSQEKKPKQIKTEYRMNPKTFTIEPIDDADKKVVLLTIDDAPDEHALEMAKTLKELQVNAIFFVNGHFLNSDEKKDVIKQIYDMGFVIGNHTKSHDKLPEMTEQQQREEILSVSDQIEKITGERPKFFRAPFGLITDYSKQLVADEKVLLMNWSFGYDFMSDYMDKQALTDMMLGTNLLGNGSNILMHDRDWTNEALRDIVTGYQEKGFGIVDPKKIETPK